jgi:serine/threonine protein kinase
VTPFQLPAELDDGRYELESVLGAGGMGTVFAAKDRTLARPVAIKVLREDVSKDPTFRARFGSEIRAVAAVEHPNVVPIYDVGVHDDGLLFIVMRLIPGRDLLGLLEEGGLAPERAMARFQQVAHALQAVHLAGFVHRDVKPANVLVGNVGEADEYAVLSDFGIARALDGSPGPTVGLPPGTPPYMAPEMWLHWTADARSDQYALACVLIQMLTGEPPYKGEDIAALRDQHCDAPLPQLGELLPEAPDGLAAAIAKALSKRPEDRFDSVAAFAAEALADPFEDTLPPDGVTDSAEQRRLTANQISTALFGIAPDRDEKAAHLAMETFLTLWANDYEPPVGKLRSPKRRNAALRSLAMQTNFFEGFDGVVPGGKSAEQLGSQLASGQDFANSANLSLAQRALRSLVDPQTEQGSAGASLMLPFHESLLWFDARKSGAAGRWAVRKVNMRGTGITLARMILAPPASAGVEAADDARVALDAVRRALTAPSPFASLAQRLAAVAPFEEQLDPEQAENAAWRAAERPELVELVRRVARHARNISRAGAASPSLRLMQLRQILALDVAFHILSRSWQASATAPAQRYLLLTYAPEARRENRVRIASEASYQAARQTIIQALIATIAKRGAELSQEPGIDFESQFEKRSALGPVAEEMQALAPGDPAAYAPVAGRVYEEAKGGGYGRPADAFRVVLESLEMLNGTGAYRWLRAGPDLLGAMIAAVGGGPMEAPEFFTRIRDEWSIVVGEAEAVETSLESVLDGGFLNRNARHLERLLVASGLAQALSDQTCMVGQRFREAT